MTDLTLLSIDTCEGTCSAAIVRGGQVLSRRMEKIGRGHAERLLPMISEMMAEADVQYDVLYRVVVCTGPGTFTGLRIGLSVARGLALAKDIPCLGLMSLPVLAAQAEEIDHPVHAIVMGRGGQGFYQRFRGRDDMGLPAAETEAACLDGEDIAAQVAAWPGVVVGSGATLVGEASHIDAVDPVVLARLGAMLTPEEFLPEPAYLREADAKKGKALLPVES